MSEALREGRVSSPPTGEACEPAPAMAMPSSVSMSQRLSPPVRTISASPSTASALPSTQREAVAASLQSKLAFLRQLGHQRNMQSVSAAAVAGGAQPPMLNGETTPDDSPARPPGSARRLATLESPLRPHVHYAEITVTPLGDKKGQSPTIKEESVDDGSDDWHRPSRTDSFHTLNGRNGRNRTRRAGLVGCCGSCGRYIAHAFLWTFVFFVAACPSLAVTHESTNALVTFFIAIFGYFAILALVWLALLTILYRGRLYGEIRKALQCFRASPRDEPPTLLPGTSVVIQSPMQRPARPRSVSSLKLGVLEPPAPPRPPPPPIGENDSPEDPSLQFRGAPPGLKRVHTSTAAFGGSHPFSAVPLAEPPTAPTRRLASDADLVLFYWSTQKEKIRRNTEQAVQQQMTQALCSPAISHALSRDFAVPTAMTTGQLGPHLSPPTTHVSPYRYPPWIGNFTTRTHHDDLADLKQLGKTAHGDSTAGSETKRTVGPRVSLRNARRRLHSLCMQLHDLPAFQMSMLLRNCAWVGAYLTLMSAIHRDGPDEEWDTSRLHAAFWTVESVFMWMISWDYLLMLAAAPDKFRYIISSASIVDLSTMGTAKFAVACYDVPAADQYTIYFGSLRVLRLVRIESILSLVVPWISEVKLKVASLFVGSMVILLMFACLMFALESPSYPESYYTLYDFFFFAVVTISTVGFGDFTPNKGISKAIVIVAILAALAFLPSQVQKLISTLQAPPLSLGRVPALSADFIVIAGPISPRQLARICREWSVALPGCCRNLLVIAPYSISEYEPIIRTAFVRGNMRVAALQDQASPLKLRHYYQNARAVFVVGNVRPYTERRTPDQQSNDYEAKQLLDDHQTLMRFLGAQHVCWPERPVCVQLHDGTTKHLVTEMGAYHVVCLQHVKMKLMAKSCSDCPGFLTLIVNLFHQATDEYDFANPQYAARRLSDTTLDKDRQNYWRGAHFQLYRVEFPRCFYGVQFTVLARYLLVQFDAFLLGVACVTKEYWINPVGYCVGDELNGFTDWPFAGVVACSALSVAQEIAGLKNLVIPPSILRTEEQNLRRKHRDKASILTSTVAARRPSSSPIPSECSIGATELETPFAAPIRHGDTDARQTSYDTGTDGAVPEVMNTYIGLREVQDVDAAMTFVFRDPQLPLIVVCGWPRGVPVFLATLSRTRKSNVIILAPDYPPGLAADNFLPFAGSCAWVRGSAIDVTDLLRAGVLQAQSCAVFSAPQVPWKTSFNVEKTDTQAVLAREFIYALHNSDTLMERRLSHLLKRQTNAAVERGTTLGAAMQSPLEDDEYDAEEGTDQQRAPMTWMLGNALTTVNHSALHGGVTRPTNLQRIVRSEPESQLDRGQMPDEPPQRGAPLVIVELRQSSHIEYIRSTPMPSNLSWSARIDHGDDDWTQDGAYVNNPEYTAGRVLLEEMLHGMITCALPVSRFCMDTRVIDHLVEGVHMPLPPGTHSKSPLLLEPLPVNNKLRSFGALMSWCLREELKLVIGIFRKVDRSLETKTPLDLLQGDDAAMVISCPPLDMPIRPDDRMYVLAACPPEALGILFEGGGAFP